MSRALWAGAAGGTAELCLLAARADAAARRAGAPMSEPRHRYRPHLTPARDRKGAHVDLQPYAEALRGFEGGAWEVGELALVHSRLPVSREPPAPGGAGGAALVRDDRALSPGPVLARPRPPGRRDCRRWPLGSESGPQNP